MRNLLLIHLESVNIFTFRLHPEWFNNIIKWERASVSFLNYYSSATSTLMVMTDLSYGGMCYNESCRGIRWKLGKRVYQESLPDKLKKAGFRTIVLGYPDNPVDIPWVNDNGFVGQTVIMEEEETYSGYIGRIESFINESDKPFFLWACSFISNLSYNGELDINEGLDGFTRRVNGYKQLDSDVSRIMKMLEDSDKLKETTVVFYGDHGDDFFSHGYYGGLTHATPTYAPLIHTPFFIYDSRLEASKRDELISTVDLRGIIEGLIAEERNRKEISLDGLIPNNEYVFSRSMFAMQPGTNKVFVKSYSITDGEFILIASKYGLEMYELASDPGCYHDLLQYGNIISYRYIWDEVIINNLRYHARSLLDIGSFQRISESFSRMIIEIDQWISKMYDADDSCWKDVEIKLDKARYCFNKDENEGFIDENYFFGKQIILYCAGEYGKKCYDYLKPISEIVRWVDNNYSNINQVYDIQIESPEMIFDCDFDLVYIAVLDPVVKREIFDSLVADGITKNKILW